MRNRFSSKALPKATSISRRFSYALISIITLLLISFTAVVIFYNLSRIESDMQKRLDNAILFAENSLSIPLWNLDYMLVNDFVDALFLDDSIVYIKLSWKDTLISERARNDFKLKNIQSEFSPDLIQDPDLIARSSKIW